MEKFSKTEKIIATLYFIWFFANLITFFYSENGPDSILFWPFGTEDKSLLLVYDVTEFAVFTGVPLLLLAGYRLAFSRSDTAPVQHRHHQHTSSGFLIAFLNEKIRAEELVQKINAAENRPVSNDYLNELKADREKATSTGMNSWLTRAEVKKKYRHLRK